MLVGLEAKELVEVGSLPANISSKLFQGRSTALVGQRSWLPAR